MTPEGKIKQKINKVLTRYEVYFFMPVQWGYGAAGLDYHCITNGGLPFFVEAKAPGKVPTARQEELIGRLKKKHRASTFVVSNDETLAELEIWLKVNDERDELGKTFRAIMGG